MTIESINYNKCVRCGECKVGCPTDVIRWDVQNNKPVIKYAKDCQICGLCAEYCPVDAIYISAAKSAPIATGWW